jgi:hypothetical protein
MKDYILRFEFYGRKMSTKVRAYNLEDAKRQINDRLNFISIEDVTEPDYSADDMLNNIKNLFGIK